MLKTIDKSSDYEITAQCLVDDYIHDHLRIDSERANYRVTTISSFKLLNNVHFWMESNLNDGKIYEVIYNNSDHCWTVTAYGRIETVKIEEE